MCGKGFTIFSLVFFNISGNRETFTTKLTKKTNLVLLWVSNYCSCRVNVSNYDCALMPTGKSSGEFWRIDMKKLTAEVNRSLIVNCKLNLH